MTPEHSPLGFSGAERWSNCPGSVALIASLPPDAEDADPEYRRAGVAAHAAAAWCLRKGADAWEAPLEWEGYSLTAEDMRAIQFYLDTVRASGHLSPHIEEMIHAPEIIHELAYGTIDHYEVDHITRTAVVTDYKHGEGIFVDVVENPQLMGYAALVLSTYRNLEHFVLRIVQPRCQEPFVREWKISTKDLIEWRDNKLIPAMNRAARLMAGNHLAEQNLKPGSWCLFCKAKEALACPALEHNALVVEQAGPVAERVSDQRLGDLYQKLEPLKIMAKAIEAEVLRRRLAGIDVPGSKTVLKKTFRVWKTDAEEALTAALGSSAMTEPELKGPVQIEALGALGKALVKQFAYSPDAGYTVAPLSDRRKAVTVQKPSEDFKHIST